MPSDEQFRMLRELAQKNNHLEKDIYEVASIGNDRVEDGEKQYFVRWRFTHEYRYGKQVNYRLCLETWNFK